MPGTTGLLRRDSSYGPPLDLSETFNGEDPSVNAYRNSHHPSIPTITRSRSASTGAIESTGTHRRATRRVSFSKDSAPFSPESSTSEIPEPLEIKPPRNASDPGPASSTSWFRSVLKEEPKKPRLLRSRSKSVDMIDAAISHIVRIMPKKKGEDSKAAETRVRQLLKVDDFRKELRDVLERHERDHDKFASGSANNPEHFSPL